VTKHLAFCEATMIITTHEIGFAREIAHRTTFFSSGARAEKNMPEEFFHNRRHERAKLFLAQILH